MCAISDILYYIYFFYFNHYERLAVYNACWRYCYNSRDLEGIEDNESCQAIQRSKVSIH